jgi:hypothetical protein
MSFYVWLSLYLAALYVIWRVVKTGADEDARREELRRHLEEVA